ncbi:MAG TPA: hypothetical protein VG845_06410 [Dehalococcoidia bacterium]|jgi:head-tail adaptor|nr:hypothetical protein [Dehalococcoidia bacterium]
MTENSSAEAAMRVTCDAILRGDLMAAMNDLTPDAFAQAMSLAATITALPTPESYAIEAREEADGEHRFRVRFKTSSQDIVAAAAWRQFDGVWKITSIAAEGLHG